MSSRHFETIELVPGVFAAIATREGHAVSNAGVIDLGDTTVVVDAFLTPQAGSDLRGFAEEAAMRISGDDEAARLAPPAGFDGWIFPHFYNQNVAFLKSGMDEG